MYSIDIKHWPLGVALVVLLFTAWSQIRRNRVPNAMVLPLILVGWLVAVLADRGLVQAGGTFVGSLLATFAALGVLLPAYRRGLGGGCVKSQMAMGAWVGCAVGPVAAMVLTALAALAGDVCTRLAYRCPLADGLYRLSRLDPDEPTVLFSAQVTHSLGAAVALIAYVVIGLVCGAAIAG